MKERYDQSYVEEKDPAAASKIKRREEEIEAGRADLSREQGGEERKTKVKEKTKGEGTRAGDIG